MHLAICGTDHNVGTTHFALALSNYLCNKCGATVAYLEVNSSDEISAICPLSLESNICFSYYNIQFFPRVTLADLPTIFTLHFDYFILDFGAFHSRACREFFQADLCFVTGIICKWKPNGFQAFLDSYHQYMKPDKIIFLESMNVHKIQLSVKDYGSLAFRHIPFLNNPFQITSQDWEFYQRLVKDFINIPHYTFTRGLL